MFPNFNPDATRKAEALEGNLKNSLKTLDAALIQQRQERSLIQQVIAEVKAEQMVMNGLLLSLCESQVCS